MSNRSEPPTNKLERTAAAIERLARTASRNKKALRGSGEYAMRFATELGALRQRFEDLRSSFGSSDTAKPFIDQIATAVSVAADPSSDIKDIIASLTEVRKICRRDLVGIDAASAIPAYFAIPAGLPAGVLDDLQEAMRAFTHGCYFSAVVMSRRAYEGMLWAAYRTKSGVEPRIATKCKLCGKVIGEGFMSVSELHKWASDQGLIRTKLKGPGFVFISVGAGSAHPTDNFPREKPIAHLTIEEACLLLGDLQKSLSLAGS